MTAFIREDIWSDDWKVCFFTPNNQVWLQSDFFWQPHNLCIALSTNYIHQQCRFNIFSEGKFPSFLRSLLSRICCNSVCAFLTYPIFTSPLYGILVVVQQTTRAQTEYYLLSWIQGGRISHFLENIMQHSNGAYNEPRPMVGLQMYVDGFLTSFHCWICPKLHYLNRENIMPLT